MLDSFKFKDAMKKPVPYGIKVPAIIDKKSGKYVDGIDCFRFVGMKDMDVKIIEMKANGDDPRNAENPESMFDDIIDDDEGNEDKGKMEKNNGAEKKKKEINTDENLKDEDIDTEDFYAMWQAESRRQENDYKQSKNEGAILETRRG